MDPVTAASVGIELWKIGGIAAVLLAILVFGGWLMYRFFVDLVKSLGKRLDVVQGEQAKELRAVVTACTDSFHAVAAEISGQREVSAQVVRALKNHPCSDTSGSYEARAPAAPPTPDTKKPLRSPFPRAYHK